MNITPEMIAAGAIAGDVTDEKAREVLEGAVAGAPPPQDPLEGVEGLIAEVHDAIDEYREGMKGDKFGPHEWPTVDGIKTTVAQCLRRSALSQTPSPDQHLVGREAAMRKAGQVVIDDLIDRGGWCIASDDDLADYMTRIVDACVRAATTEGQP